MHLEDVGEISEVKDVVKLDGCWEEGGGHSGVELNGTCHNLVHTLLNVRRESTLAYVLRENGLIDGLQSFTACR